MGTTVVCALVNEGRMITGHVGDSRLYVLSGGKLAVQTRDDTWAAMVLQGENGDPGRIGDHPMRNVLTNVLGAREQTDIHLTERPLVDGERVLLCSDGVHGVVDDRTLQQLLSQKASPEGIARSVLKAALERGTRDNVTAIVIEYKEHPDGA
jgi:protein phosphatase